MSKESEEVDYYVIRDAVEIELPREIELYGLEDVDLLQMYLRRINDGLRVSGIVEGEAGVIHGMIYRGTLRSTRNMDKQRHICSERSGVRLQSKRRRRKNEQD